MEERLLRYNDIIAMIDKLEWKIKVKEREDIQASGPVLEVTGIKAQGFKTSPIENQIARNVDEINMYKKQIEELKAEKQMIDSLINTLDDYHKRIIELRYKYNKTSYQIGNILYRAKRTINKELKKALAELNEKYEKSPEKYPVSSHQVLEI